MFDKKFNDMLAVDVSQYTKERDGVTYLPWASCKKLLHDNGAETVMFWPVPGPDGSTLRKSELEFCNKDGKTNRAYEVLVHIQVDSIQWEIVYPVLNGNVPVHDGTLNQLRVHNAVRRAFVKGVAERIGLGFTLWLEDDLPDEPQEDLSKHNLFKCKQRFEELVTAKINQGIPLPVITDRVGMDVETFKAQFALYNQLARLEKAVWEMTP